MNPTLTPEFERQVQEGVARHQAEDAAGVQAAAAPFPGPLRDIYAGIDELPVKGSALKVRMFWDVDFETLEKLGHPMASFLATVIAGKTKDLEWYTGRGAVAWQINWILTRPVDEVDSVVKQGGTEAVKQQARTEFGKLQIAQLAEFVGPVMEQLMRYWGPAPKPEAAEGEKSPSPCGEPSTGSAGGSTK